MKTRNDKSNSSDAVLNSNQNIGKTESWKKKETLKKEIMDRQMDKLCFQTEV